jgi:hypothetical protein
VQDAPEPLVEAFAFYLPQFYPIDLNSHWWGEGFTEWTSVLRAHRGWRSPPGTVLTPGELGFYDLRDPSVRACQGKLARDAGLAALCVYHYYSAGERLLPTVEDAILADGAPDFPFFLGWANHDWTLAWKGQPQDMISKQRYDECTSDTHIERILEAMSDPRYYRVDGRPLLFVYDPLHIIEYRRVFDRWREVASRRGQELMLLGNASGTFPLGDAGGHGLDAWVQGTGYVFGSMNARRRALRSLRSPSQAVRFARHRDIYWSYEELSQAFSSTHDRFPSPTVPVVVSSWNNVGRRTRKASATDISPEGFERALRAATERAPVVGTGPDRRRLVAINAWNEWGEGMTMEPSVELGRAMIEAAARVLRSAR